MSEQLIDGFRFHKWAGGRQFLVVESDRLEECVAYCNSRHIEWLHVTPSNGYYLDNLDFLDHCPHVTGVFLMSGFADVGGLYRLPRLAFLSAICRHTIDFSSLPALIDLSTDWNPKIDGALFRANLLTRLWLRGYKPNDHNLARLAALESLEELYLLQSPISSASGIGTLRALRRLELAYCPKLVDIDVFSDFSDRLEELELDHCRKIRDLARVAVLRKLRKLILADCREIASLSFIKQMPCLEFLSFVNTNVLDGDMSPCFGLKYAGFLSKRRYSHTFKEVEAIIESSGCGLQRARTLPTGDTGAPYRNEDLHG